MLLCQNLLVILKNVFDNVKYRWASASEFNLHNIDRLSLAEAAQASMKAAIEINVSLIDAVCCNITDSACRQSKWEIQLNGQRFTGRGPSLVQFSERSSRRQIKRAYCFIDEEEEIFITTEELPALTLSLSKSLQPPKAKQKN